MRCYVKSSSKPTLHFPRSAPMHKKSTVRTTVLFAVVAPYTLLNFKNLESCQPSGGIYFHFSTFFLA
jgi:hypothetical protein